MEFFLVKIFTEFSSKERIKLRFPSIIPSIMQAYSRQSFIVETPQGAASLVETLSLTQKAESPRQERGGTQTQESKSSSGLKNLIITSGQRPLPSDHNQSQLRNAGGNESNTKRTRKPKAWRGQWRGGQLTAPPSDLRGPNTSDGCPSLPLCLECGAVIPLNNIRRPWHPHGGGECGGGNQNKHLAVLFSQKSRHRNQ